MRAGVRCRALVGLGVAGALLAGPASAGAGGSSSAAADVKPFGKIACAPREGVRFCEGSIATRVKTFDGVPLDVNVTLPGERSRRLPLLIQLHGWGGGKGGLDASREWAERGYAVLNYTARGFGDSCGTARSRAADPQGCARGWIHLADSRYEVRDSQHLAGLLADQGLVHPRRIGVTGGSYGGGQSLQLATLRDRVRLHDGSYVPWRSPQRRLRMRIAAAVPTIGWSDLVYSLVPNGRTLDYLITGPRDDLSPIGVMKQSYVGGLYALGRATGYYAPRGVDPSADLDAWFALVSAGEPYDENPNARAVVRELALYHSAYYLDMSVPPAPVLISNGFTDDLFPVDEAVRYANRVLWRYPWARVAQLHFDYGHPRGQGKPADTALLGRRTREWLDRYVKGERVETLRGVEVLTQTCPRQRPSGGPFRARSWLALSPGEVRFRHASAKTVLSTSGDPQTGRTVDPISFRGACATTPAADAPGTATYRLPTVEGSGYTLLGSPTVIADLDVSGREPALAARLWDVAPGGETQTLVARALYRPREDGRQVFQLHPNGWHFAPGHTPKLELLGRDAPYGRPSNFPWSIVVSRLRLRLPVHEAPNGREIRWPAPPFLP